ncbi:MAG TPA: hypothetical protein VFP33_02340 [Gallionella sp.]|nr:hypothetical protein [Gallionella sp.]
MRCAYCTLRELRERIAQRMAQAGDASEADIAVLEKLAAVVEPVSTEERAFTADFADEKKGWEALGKLVKR